MDKLGDEQGARSALEAAVTASGGQLDARVLLANVDLKLGDRAAAEDQFEAVLLLDPANHDALLGLAQEQLKEKRFTDVVDLLGPRVKDASSADLLQLLMQAYVGLGRTADAEKVRAQLDTSTAASLEAPLARPEALEKQCPEVRFAHAATRSAAEGPRSPPLRYASQARERISGAPQTSRPDRIAAEWGASAVRLSLTGYRRDSYKSPHRRSERSADRSRSLRSG